MRIGVNLMFVVPGEVGASEYLLTNLVSRMADSEHEIVVFAARGFGDAHPLIRSRSTVVEVPWSSAAQGLRIAAEHSWLPAEARRRRLDLIHHGVGTTPFLKTLPSAVTVHDIQYRHYPENFPRLKLAWLRLNVPHSVRRCEVVTVPSEWAKKDLVASFHVDPEKVRVVPFGSEDLFGESPSPADAVRQRYRLERPFFLFPARTYPHKNHRFLVEAYAPLAGEADLVLTGPPWFRDGEVAAAARRMGLAGSVRHVGLVPRGDLAGLYRGAAALTYPSRFEGFGAPVLEAMALGCPVLASNVTALPEVAGDAGILLDPDDLDGWRDAMARVLHDSALRDGLVEKGRRRASQFSWERSAALQLDAYRQALAR